MRLTSSQMEVIRVRHRELEKAKRALREVLLAALPSGDHELDLMTGEVSPPDDNLPEDEG